MKAIKNFRRSIYTIILTIMTMVSVMPISSVQAADYYGGGEIAYKAYTVYSSSDFKNKIGKINQYEGYTVLMQDRPDGNLWVEYSTSNGAKRGYIKVPADENLYRGDGLGKVKTSSTVYYGRTDKKGKYGSYQSAGSVSAGEMVAMLAKNDDWAYIEYNTNSGRKRGYMKYSNLKVYNRPGVFDDLYCYNKETTKKITGKKYVYSGPTSLYTQVGYVENEEVKVFQDLYVYDNNNKGHKSQYIEYESGGKTKSGFLVFGP